MNLSNIKNKINDNKGFVILFTLALTGIILAIALGVANVALKEVTFSTSAKSTNDAFFAADTGVECALYHDIRVSPSVFEAGPNLNCADNSVTIIGVTPPSSHEFVLTDLGPSGDSCAIVTVEKFTTPVAATKITSRGYNIGDNNCNSTNINRLERVLEVTY